MLMNTIVLMMQLKPLKAFLSGDGWSAGQRCHTSGIDKFTRCHGRTRFEVKIPQIALFRDALNMCGEKDTVPDAFAVVYVRINVIFEVLRHISGLEKVVVLLFDRRMAHGLVGELGHAKRGLCPESAVHSF